MAVVATSVPDLAHVCDLLTVSDLDLQSSGYVDNFSLMLRPLIKEEMKRQLTSQVRAMASRALSAHVQRMFSLSVLPHGVTVSIRQLRMTGEGIVFQPVLGTIGAALSTFVPPPLAPP